MNTSEIDGEPSCKRQENGDASPCSDRPLKKARFAWQVKGNRKYIKSETPEVRPSSIPVEEHDIPSTSQNKSNAHELRASTEQNLEILGDYLLKQDFSTLDPVITDSDKSVINPGTSLSTEKIDCPRYVSSYDNKGRTSKMRDEHASVSMSMVTSQTYIEDQCIARWQARQMAKGLVDNTINRVLDSWMDAPLPDFDNRSLALDVAEFINNLPGDNTIENEGILMAISAHGLQNTSGSSSSSESTKEPSDKLEVFTSRSSSPATSEEEPANLNNNDLDSNMNSITDLPWSYDNREANDGKSDFSISSSSYLSYVDNDQLQSSTVGYDENIDNNFTSHFDFMDAAVSFAIQNKGLTSFGTDYG